MKRIALIALLVGATVLAGCSAQPGHSPADAGREAEKFVTALFVRGDAVAAYKMLDPLTTQGRKAADIRRLAVSSPGYGQVTSVKATEYEPVAGQAALDIYLIGTDGTRALYYKVRMDGTAGAGYRAADIVVSQQALPSSGMRTSLTQGFGDAAAGQVTPVGSTGWTR